MRTQAHHPHHSHSKTLHVLAGEFKGRSFSSPCQSSTHPMGAREKLALFNMLQSFLHQAIVLDAYAGSGALGLEALSRGAAQVTFVECSPIVIRNLRQNLRVVLPVNRLADIQVIQSPVASFANSASSFQTTFDIIIADPPYDTVNTKELASLVHLLRHSGILALSLPATYSLPSFPQLACTKTHQYAGAKLALYHKIQQSTDQ